MNSAPNLSCFHCQFFGGKSKAHFLFANQMHSTRIMNEWIIYFPHICFYFLPDAIEVFRRTRNDFSSLFRWSWMLLGCWFLILGKLFRHSEKLFLLASLQGIWGQSDALFLLIRKVQTFTQYHTWTDNNSKFISSSSNFQNSNNMGRF